MKREIKIKAIKMNGKRIQTYTVEAEIFGPVAVHEDKWYPGWRVTQIKSGWSLTDRLIQYRAAVALAKRLSKREDLINSITPTNCATNIEARAYFTKCYREVKSARWTYL